MKSEAAATAHSAFIDGLRGLAFLGVFFAHVAMKSGGLPPTVRRLLESGGQNGVRLFFLVSALTLFLSLDARGRSEGRPTLNFFLRRFFRIAPMFYLSLVFYVWWLRWIPVEATAQSPMTIAGIVATLGFVHGVSPLWIDQVVPGGWSITAEMTFYLLVPFLFRTLRTVDHALWLALAAQVGSRLLSAVALPLLGRFGGPWPEGALTAYVGWWFPAQFPTFCLGILVYFLARDRIRQCEREAVDPPESTARGRATLGLLVAAAVYVASFTRNVFDYVPIFEGALFLFCLSASWSQPRWLGHPVLSTLGKISFSGYLVHFFFFVLAKQWIDAGFLGLDHRHWLVRFVAYAATCLAGTVVVATFTYRYVEVPGQALCRKLIRVLESPGVAPETAR